MKKTLIISLFVLIVLSAAVLYQYRYNLYLYLPASVETEVDNKDGVFVDNATQKPFSGRIKEVVGNTITIYSYKNGKLDGPNVVYINGRIKESGYWKDGLQNGLFQNFSEEGVLFDSGMFENGERHGASFLYYPTSGSLKTKANFENGKATGIWKNYYEDGTLQVEQSYINGKQSGITKQYYPNGNLYAEMGSEDGNPQGIYIIYLENGEIQEQGYFEDGKLFLVPDKQLNPALRRVQAGEITIEELSEQGTAALD